MTTTLKRIFSDKTFLFTFALALLSLIFGTVRASDIDLKTILALLSLIILISIFEIVDKSQIVSKEKQDIFYKKWLSSLN